MKTSMKKIAAVVALSAFIAGPATAMVSASDLRSDISTVIGSGGNVSATVNGGVVTLSGFFADTSDKNAAVRVAKASPGVERVIDLTSTSN